MGDTPLTAYDYDAMVFLNRVDDQLALAYARAKEAMERAEVAVAALRRDPPSAAEVTLDAGLSVFEPAVRRILEDLDCSISRPGGPSGYGIRVATEHALRRFKGKLRVAGAAHVARFGVGERLGEVRIEFDRQLEAILDNALGLSDALGRPAPEAEGLAGAEDLVDGPDDRRDPTWAFYELEAMAWMDADQPAHSGEPKVATGDRRSRQTSIADVLKQMWSGRARSLP